MARDIIINGECLVLVRGGANIPLWANGAQQLGLAESNITITPRIKHKDINVDGYGPDVPADVMVNLADAMINMTLIHFDNTVLDVCIAESMGGLTQTQFFGLPVLYAGALPPAGTLMGGLNQLYASGNHFMSVTLTSPVLGFPYNFPACYLAEHPISYPLGTKRSAVKLNWRAIPYAVPPTVTSLANNKLGNNAGAAAGTNAAIQNSYYGARSYPGELIASGVALWQHVF